MALDPMTIMTIASTVSNLGQTLQGNRMQKAGARMQAQGFRQAATSTIQAAEYNNRILELNTQRRLDALGREIGRISGEQRVAAVSSGFASTSKSKLAVMDATLDQYSRQVRHEMASLGHQQTSVMFEAQARATGLETQARTAEFQQRQRSSKNTLGMLSSVGTVLGDIGGLFNG